VVTIHTTCFNINKFCIPYAEWSLKRVKILKCIFRNSLKCLHFFYIYLCKWVPLKRLLGFWGLAKQNHVWGNYNICWNTEVISTYHMTKAWNPKLHNGQRPWKPKNKICTKMLFCEINLMTAESKRKYTINQVNTYATVVWGYVKWNV
jgi:hypothetical protein